MSSGHIRMLQSNPNFIIQTDNILARNEMSAAIIQIPFKIEFRETPGRHNKKMVKAELLFIKGRLRTRDGSILCGECINFMNHRISLHEKTIESQFGFTIPHEVINKIEKQRKGDLAMHVELTAHTAEYEELLLSDNTTKSIVTGFDNAQGHVDFQIAQSNWVNNLLPNMGHQSFRLIEVPIASQIIPEEYASALHELEEAKSFFLHGYYDKVASHCRVALEPFKKQLPELRQKIESDSEFDWMKAISAGTLDWLDKLLKTTYAITSKTHHAPSTGHFSRLDAEIIMMVTTAVIAYVGNIGREN